MLGSLLSILILVADVYAIIQIVQTNETTGSKALWIVLILVLPVIGLAIWWFAGPKP
jgi:membrane protein DedA with SNARE-associated domain